MYILYFLCFPYLRHTSGFGNVDQDMIVNIMKYEYYVGVFNTSGILVVLEM